MHTYYRENIRRCFLPFVNGFEMNGGQSMAQQRRHDDEATTHQSQPKMKLFRKTRCQHHRQRHYPPA